MADYSLGTYLLVLLTITSCVRSNDDTSTKGDKKITFWTKRFHEGFSNNHEIVDIGISFESMYEGRIAFAECTPPGKSRSCRVFVNSFRTRDEPKPDTFCDVKFEGFNNESYLGGIFIPIPLPNGKVSIWWFENIPTPTSSWFWRVSTVNMETCQTTQLNRNKIEEFFPETYAFVEGGYVAAVKGKRKCRNTFCAAYFDKDGHLKDEIEEWFALPERDGNALLQVDLFPVLLSNKSYAYLLAAHYHNTLVEIPTTQFFSLDTYGEATELDMPVDDEFNRQMVALSAKNGFIGYCVSGRKGVNTCVQKNLNDGSETSSTFHFEDESFTTLIIHNLPEGGFLLLISKCETADCSREKKVYHVVEFSNGKKLSEGIIPRPICKSNVKARTSAFFENDQKDHCLMSLCYDSNIEHPFLNDFEFFVTCLGYETNSV